eukprot:16437228-Heterocapsa_arctica.AAC.1
MSTKVVLKRTMHRAAVMNGMMPKSGVKPRAVVACLGVRRADARTQSAEYWSSSSAAEAMDCSSSPSA